MTFSPRSLSAVEEEQAPALEWEEVSCLLCGSGRRKPMLEGPDPAPDGRGLWFAVVQCQDCGLCYTNPRPNLSSMGQFYSRTYTPHQIKLKPVRQAQWYKWQRWCGGLDYRKTLPVHGQGRLLDFGCGSGSFLRRMQQQGWQVAGLDLSPQAVRNACQQGLRVLLGSLPHPELAPASFDTITMWHSLEHVHEPLAVLRAARQLLVSGGRLVVSVPNLDSLAFRWFGRHWFGLELPRHLTHFTPWTLRLMLYRAGFKTLSVHMDRHSSWLRSSSGLAGRQKTSSGWQRWLGNHTAAKLASWLAFLSRKADCMTAVAEKR